MKKKKQLNVTKQNMREFGFTDGYSGKKSSENEWIRRFCKKNMNLNTIKEYIESYRTGYQVGQCTYNDLNNTKALLDGQLSYNGKVIDVKIDDYVLNQKVKTLSPKKRKK